MKTRLAILIAAITLLAALPLHAQEGSKLNVLPGPATAKLGEVANIQVPAGYDFFDGPSLRMMMKAWGEPVSGQELGMLAPTNANWSVIFEFSEIGYVKDDDKDELDADALLAAIKAGNEEGNKERARSGNPPLIITGWEKKPHYDETTHNLEWAIRAESEGNPILNYNTRLLGRKGVMEAVLIVRPDELPSTLPAFRELLAGYDYASGQNYAEYKPGDNVAKYGLAALVLGGAGVGAAKLGMLGWLAVFFKKAWKVVVVVLIGIAAFFKKILNRITGNKDPNET